MAVATENALSGPYTANGSTTTFPFTFTVLSDADLAVMLRDSDGTETIVSTNDYTVTLAGDAPSTGSVVFDTAPASGNEVWVYLDPAFTQETEFADGHPFIAGAVNDINDKAALRDQVLRRDIDRGLMVPLGEAAPLLPLAVDRAGKYLAFDAGGDPVASDGTGADAGLRTDLAASGGSALSGFINSGTGAVTRTAQAKLRDKASPKDFGAVGDGSANDAAALATLFSAKNDVEASFSDTYAIQSGLTLTGNNRTIDGLKLKPVSTRNMTALTIGPTSPDASTTLTLNAAEFANKVTVDSTTGFAAGKLVLFTFNNPTWVAADPLAASYKFVTRIVGVNGLEIELQDNLPQAIQSAWTHSVQAWTPVSNLRLRMELDQSAQGQKKTIAAISKANPAVLTVTAHGYTNGDTITINGPLAGMTEIHGATAAITVIDANSFSIPVNSSAYSTYTGGATVRQRGFGIRLGCVDSPEIDLLAYDNDGAGAALQIDIAYNPKIVARLRNCGSENDADLDTECWTGGEIVSFSDDPSGFGATALGGHYGVFRLISSSRAETGRGFKVGKTRYCSYYVGPVCNPAFTALALTWVTQDCDFYSPAAIGSLRSAIQPTGFWTSQCYNTGNKVFGLDARGSTLDAQVNATDSVEFYGSVIGTLDIPSGGSVTMIGGSVTTVSGTGTLTRLQGDRLVVRAGSASPLDSYADNFYYNKITGNAGTNGQVGWGADARDSGGTLRSVVWLNAAGDGYHNVATSFKYTWNVNAVERLRVDATRVTFTSVPKLPVLTFATLPGSPQQGDCAVITDSNSAVFNAAAAGGGANVVKVTYLNGAWRVG
jgi:hypothetical protein